VSALASAEKDVTTSTTAKAATIKIVFLFITCLFFALLNSGHINDVSEPVFYATKSIPESPKSSSKVAAIGLLAGMSAQSSIMGTAVPDANSGSSRRSLQGEGRISFEKSSL
jgi:hypothetical protein